MGCSPSTEQRGSVHEKCWCPDFRRVLVSAADERSILLGTWCLAASIPGENGLWTPRYTLQRQLGEGAHGKVFAAWCDGLSLLVPRTQFAMGSPPVAPWSLLGSSCRTNCCGKSLCCHSCDCSGVVRVAICHGSRRQPERGMCRVGLGVRSNLKFKNQRGCATATASQWTAFAPR